MKALHIPWFHGALFAAAHSSAPQFMLRKGGVRSIEVNSGMKIGCRGGCLWVTQQGEDSDIILKSGEQFQITRSGRVVIEALEGALVSAV